MPPSSPQGESASGQGGGRQDDRQDHQQHAQDGLDIGAPVRAAGGDQGDLVLGVDQQRADGHNNHEAHGEEEHLVVLPDVAQPGGHGQQAQARQELVGGAEQRPTPR